MPNIGFGLQVRDDDDDEAQLLFNDNGAPSTNNRMPWIVLAIVGGILVLGGTLTFIFVQISRRRKHRKQRKVYPPLTRDEFVHRRKLSATNLLEEEEEETRKGMIRKSLASRSTGSVGSRYSGLADQMCRELAEIEQQETLGLREDWKRWEARERQERSVSGGHHPASSEVSIAVPSPARHPSPTSTVGSLRGDGPTTTRSISPVSPRHPSRQSPGRAASSEYVL